MSLNIIEECVANFLQRSEVKRSFVNMYCIVLCSNFTLMLYTEDFIFWCTAGNFIRNNRNIRFYSSGIIACHFRTKISCFVFFWIQFSCNSTGRIYKKIKADKSEHIFYFTLIRACVMMCSKLKISLFPIQTWQIIFADQMMLCMIK